MPEYLSPGVYVEEIDTGSKPIEGVSTSTAGMVGVTERGPVGVPVLVTSNGTFQRLFGGLLGIDFGGHRHLPHAVEGFFTNGGKRLYVVRVLDTVAATRAAFNLHYAGTGTLHESMLLRASGEGDGDAASPLIILDQGALAGGETVRIGDGSFAEYREVDPAGFVIDPTHVPLHLPLSRTQADNTDVRHISVASVLAGNLTLDQDADRGSTDLVLAATAAADVTSLESDVAAGDDVLLQIGDAGRGEFRLITETTAIDTTHVGVELDSALVLDHAAGDVVDRLDLTLGAVEVDDDLLDGTAPAGAAVAFVDDRNGNFADATELVLFRDAGGRALEVRRMGNIRVVTLTHPAIDTLPGASVAEPVNLADDAAAAALTLSAETGDGAITVDVRQDFDEGDVLRVGAGASAEYLTIDQLPNRAVAGPDPGIVVFTHPLTHDHAAGDVVRLQVAPTIAAGRPATALLFRTEAGDATLILSDGSGYAAGDFIRITTPSNQVYYAELDDDDTPTINSLAVTVPLFNAHEATSVAAERDPLFTVEALDAGGWGNRLRVSVQHETPGLVARTLLQAVIDPTHIRLASAAGVEPGTVLELLDPVTGDRIDEPVKVIHVDRTDFTITLAGTGLSAAQQTIGLAVRSREFRLTVFLLRQPDPAQPSRNDTVLDSEAFRYLSMDPRHSRYVEAVVGDIGGDLRAWDRRPEGASQYVRVRDLAPDTAIEQSVRLGPEMLVDVLPNGRLRAARHPLAGGNDSIPTLNDNLYIGDDAADPEDRTGLHSLRNIDEVSIVAIPGRVSVSIQDALISHCEEDRYRFAVLDGPVPPADTLTDVQTQRQQFDTKYAALYYPWLLIPDPFPTSLEVIRDLPIPPSGHVTGIFARTDVERGVHKAPANEVVRGIRSLSRTVNKGEHDILNPYPVNINVIRDFRTNNRGIRVWGARVITSDPDFKYVPVRRLLIFLEESIDKGLQWVVFEPNAEPLWARVRRSISDFLRVVWRNGALEGTTEEEAFFVKCDRTTMTQTDIDNGRLICLVGVAPVKPAEFVIIRIGLKTAEAES